MAVGSVLPLSSGVLVSPVVGFASGDCAGVGLAAFGSAFAPALDCASSCRKFGALPPGARGAVDPLVAAALAGAAALFDPAAPPRLLGAPAPDALLPAELERSPAPLDCVEPLDRAEPLDAAGVLDAAAAPLDPAVPGVVPGPVPALAAPPPSRVPMPLLEPRDEEPAPVEAAGEAETDLRATPMHSVRWVAL
jgi:hypothetical protein